MPPDHARRLVAEAIGTALLLIAVVGSGIMAERLSGGNVAIALLANAIATGAALVVLITIFAPVSGAHFNPAVTLWTARKGGIGRVDAMLYMLVQMAAAIGGVLIAHLMFDLSILQVSTRLREGPAQLAAEFIATFGLLLTIAGALRVAPARAPLLIGLYITGAYWFTASTSFANPAVTIARMLTDSFSGIAPSSAMGFVLAQLAATLLATPLLGWLFAEP